MKHIFVLPVIIAFLTASPFCVVDFILVTMSNTLFRSKKSYPCASVENGFYDFVE